LVTINVLNIFFNLILTARGGFNDRNTGRNNEGNNENSLQSFGGFSSKSFFLK
jgi:hypothetical protein